MDICNRWGRGKAPTPPGKQRKIAVKGIEERKQAYLLKDEEKHRQTILRIQVRMSLLPRTSCACPN